VTDADRLREAGLLGTSATGGDHQHLVCRRCGTVADVDCAAGHTPCLEPVASGGFVIDRAEVTFWGLCPQCRARKDQPGEPRRSEAQGPRR
jgi:Fur family ferric uptake transcriptional regulator